MSEKLKFHHEIFHGLGSAIIGATQTVGGIASLFWETIFFIFKPPYRIKEIFRQMKVIGVETVPLVVVVMILVGSIVMMEIRYQLMQLIHSAEWAPGFTGIFMFREASTAVVSAMIASRAGAGISAEIGTMQITEQVDALTLLRANPVHYLVVPRFIAGVLMTVILAIVGLGVSLLFAYLNCLDLHSFMSFVGMVRRFTDVGDFLVVLKKSFFFGMAIPIISCYYGFQAQGGAQGVGIATTRAVVYSLLVVIFIDFLLTGSAKMF